MSIVHQCTQGTQGSGGCQGASRVIGEELGCGCN